MNVGDRIKQRRKQIKMSADQLAAIIGKNRATIYRYESRDIENMPIEVLEPIAEALRVSPAYLMGWEGETEEVFSEYNYFPVTISAGAPDYVEAIANREVTTIKLPDTMMGKWAGHADISIMRINGESMNKTIPHRSLIAVKETDLKNLKDGDAVLYSQNGEYSVKKIYKTNGSVIFRPDSTDNSFTDHVVSNETTDLKIYGKVVVYVVELS